MNKGYVYMIQNILNGKKYIGSRRISSLAAAKADTYFGSGVVLNKAINKYGKESFIKTIMAFVDNAYSYEEDLLIRLDVANSKEFYNRKNSACNPPVLKGDKSPARIRSLNNTHWLAGKPSNSKGHKRSQEAKRLAALHSAGRVHSAESKIKMSINQKKTWLGKNGSLHPKSKSIYCPELDMSFGSLREAAAYTNCSIGNICSCCKGNMKHTKSLTFKYN